MDEKELQDWADWADVYKKTTTDEDYGAGEKGTDELKDKYTKETPGQTSDVNKNFPKK